jgi:hypothetical protein
MTPIRIAIDPANSNVAECVWDVAAGQIDRIRALAKASADDYVTLQSQLVDSKTGDLIADVVIGVDPTKMRAKQEGAKPLADAKPTSKVCLVRIGESTWIIGRRVLDEDPMLVMHDAYVLHQSTTPKMVASRHSSDAHRWVGPFVRFLDECPHAMFELTGDQVEQSYQHILDRQ